MKIYKYDYFTVQLPIKENGITSLTREEIEKFKILSKEKELSIGRLICKILKKKLK